jgi:nucleoside-diphosphate-sugar epimerase
VRGEDRIKQLHSAYGSRVKAELYADLDDTERTIEVASQHDIVINTTLAFHPESAAALVQALAKRKQATGKDTFMIHTSGTSNMADYPITKQYLESRTFDDVEDDIYGYEKERNELFAYGQRTSELGVVDAGLEQGVKTIVIMSPTIYGRGTGVFNQTSIQVPAYASTTLKAGHGVIVGDGQGVWDHVHIEDLAELYEIVLLDILEKDGKNLPFGKKGIIFSGNGRFKWLDIAEGVAEAAHKAGLIQSPEVKSVSLKEGAELFPHGNEIRVELGLSSNSRTESTTARKLGWKPKKGPESWREGFTEEVKAAAEKLGK